MIVRFGRTFEDKAKRKAKQAQWHPAFAWRPVQTLDGVWVWLERVERISYYAEEVPAAAPSTFIMSWCYRLLE